jgi:hypothetical protein
MMDLSNIITTAGMAIVFSCCTKIVLHRKRMIMAAVHSKIYPSLRHRDMELYKNKR